MAKVHGKDVAVLFYDEGEDAWVPYACGRSGTLETVTELIETSVTGAGPWRTYKPKVNTFTASIEGLVNLNTPNKLSVADLRAKQINWELLLIRWQREDMAGNYYTDEFYAYITSVVDVHSFDNVMTFDVALQGTGELVQIFTPTPIIRGIVYRYEYTATGGEKYFTAPILVNKDVLEVNNDGLGYSPIITSGTPIGKEAKYNAGAGRVDFPYALEPGQQVYVLYQDLS